MSGRDHETDHDGECFPDCRECRIKELEKRVERLCGALDKVLDCIDSSEGWSYIISSLEKGDF